MSSLTEQPVQLTAAKLADELMDVAQELERPACLGAIREVARNYNGTGMPRSQAIVEQQAARLKQLSNLLRG